MSKFIPNEEAFVGFATTLTGTVTGPKVADVTGAVDLTPLCTGLNASATGNAVPTPSFDNLFETSIPGTNQATFTADFYRDNGSGSADLAWITLPRLTAGYFIIARFGQIPSTAGRKCEVWPVIVLSRAVANMTNNTSVTFTVTCSVPAIPGEDAVVVT